MSNSRMVQQCGMLAGTDSGFTTGNRRPASRRSPAAAALTAEQRFPFLTPGQAAFAAGLNLKSRSQPPLKRGLGSLASGHEKFAAGIKFR